MVRYRRVRVKRRIPHVRRERRIAHASPSASHRRPSDRHPRDRLAEPARRDVGRARHRAGRGEELCSGADQRAARPRLPHRGGPPVPPGPGPFILAGRANKLAALSLDHRLVAELSTLLDCNVLVGVRVGDAMVFTDYAGQESPGLTFVARTHARRPLYTSAAGKTLLANVPDDEMHRCLDFAGPEHEETSGSSSRDPRSARAARATGGHLRDAYVVRTPLVASDGTFIAAISAPRSANVRLETSAVAQGGTRTIAPIHAAIALAPADAGDRRRRATAM